LVFKTLLRTASKTKNPSSKRIENLVSQSEIGIFFNGNNAENATFNETLKQFPQLS
jgi:hypothetical protein